MMATAQSGGKALRCLDFVLGVGVANGPTNGPKVLRPGVRGRGSRAAQGDHKNDTSLVFSIDSATGLPAHSESEQARREIASWNDHERLLQALSYSNWQPD